VWPPPKEEAKKGEGGWARVPRTVAVIGCVFSENSKGADLLPTYIELLARTPEEGIVEIGYEEEHAALSGFTPNPRGVKSWRARLAKLAELGFVRVFTGARGVDQVIIVHPTLAMTQLHANGGVSANLWQQFNKILVDTGVWKSPEEEVAVAAPQPPVLIIPDATTAPATIVNADVTAPVAPAAETVPAAQPSKEVKTQQ
jgi:hypothetical protein